MQFLFSRATPVNHLGQGGGGAFVFFVGLPLFLIISLNLNLYMTEGEGEEGGGYVKKDHQMRLLLLKISSNIREDTHKKSVFFSGRTTQDLTPPPLMVQWSMPLFFVLFFQSYNSLKRILTKKNSNIFGLKKSDFFLANIVFEPVKIYTDKIGCTLVKIWTKMSYLTK